MKLLVLFGSESDQYIYEPLCKGLKTEHEVQFEVCSAHRNPDRLGEILKEEEYDAVVAGAGIAAHLPGVIASQTTKPVFGVPVEANFGGLDALLSIQQMPFGVPVMTCGAGRSEQILPFINHMAKQTIHDLHNVKVFVDEKIMKYEYVTIELNRLKELATQKEVNLEIVHDLDSEGLKIIYVHKQEDIRPMSGCLHVPLLDKQVKENYSKVLGLYEMTRVGGLWLGVNNGRNALLSYLKFS